MRRPPQAAIPFLSPKISAESVPLPGLILPDAEDLIQARGAGLRLGGDPAFCKFGHGFVQVS
jgi:antirestriction protein ArdC